MVPLVLTIQLLKMLFLLCSGLDMQFLDILLELIDFVHELLLVLLMLRPVHVHLLSCRRDGHLKLLPVVLAVVDDGHVLRLVLLKIVEHLKFLVQGNQGVQSVLELDILFFECKLQLSIALLVKQGLL